MANRLISKQIREKVVRSRENGLSFRAIGLRYNLPISTCSAIIRRYKLGKMKMDAKSDDDSDAPSSPSPVKKHDSEEEEEEDQDEYVVEKIIEKRKRGGKTEYFIKWKDWPHEDNTWEPEEHLSCPDLVKEFEDQLKLKKEKKLAKAKEKERERAEKLKAREKEREKEREKAKDSEKVKDGDKSRDRRERLREKSRDRLKNRDEDRTNRKRKARVIDSSSGSPSPAHFENESSSSRFFPSDDEISSVDGDKIELEKRLKSLSNKSSRERAADLLKEEEDELMNEDDNDEEDEVTGFDRGLEPKKIMGAIRIEDKLMFLIRWESCDKCDLILAEEANLRCPQVVISYYEKRLKWVPDFNSDLCD